MKLKSLEKATKILTRVQDLDSEIVRLEKLAIRMASGSFETELNLSYKDLDKKPNPKMDFDEDVELTGLRSRFLAGAFMDFGTHLRKAGEDSKENLLFSINEIEALSIIGTLMSIKQDQRKSLISQLKQFGYES